MLFLAMQVRIMAACMESQIDKQEYTASAQSRGRDGTGGINQPTILCLWVLHNIQARGKFGCIHRCAHRVFFHTRVLFVSSGGSKGARGMRALSIPKFLHFHAVFGKNWLNNRLPPPLGLAPPPLENSRSATYIYGCI